MRVSFGMLVTQTPVYPNMCPFSLLLHYVIIIHNHYRATEGHHVCSSTKNLPFAQYNTTMQPIKWLIIIPDVKTTTIHLTALFDDDVGEPVSENIHSQTSCLVVIIQYLN